MKRKAVHFAAALAELLRFAALLTLADGLGALRAEGGGDRVFRYAAAPQLLLAAGFFFMWLDADRYGVYRPLLVVGKLACLAALFPLAAQVVGLLRNPVAASASPVAMAGAVLAMALVDAAGLAVLARARPAGRGPEGGNAEGPGGRGAIGPGPDGIERIEA